MSQEPEQPALFDLPDALHRRRPQKRAPVSGHVSYTKFKPARRTLCDDCIRDIHERGIAVAPLPSGVRWRRSANGVTDLLCPRHKDARLKADG